MVLGVRERSYDQVRVVAAEVVEEHGDVVHNSTLSVAFIMRRSDVVAGHMVVIRDFAIVRDVRVEWTVPIVTDAALDCIVVVCLLLIGQPIHFAILFEVLYDYSLPPDELVEKLDYGVVTRE